MLQEMQSRFTFARKNADPKLPVSSGLRCCCELSSKEKKAGTFDGPVVPQLYR